jgi:two-component system sensor histidine kinase UhpB
MSRSLSLRLRLNLAFAALLAFGLLADVASTIAGAGKRIEPEIANSTALADAIIRGALRGMREGPDVGSQLDDLATSLDKLRHVAVTFESDNPVRGTERVATGDEKRRPPDWFIGLIHPTTKVRRIDAIVEGRPRGTFVVAGDPDDEMSELWDGVVELAIDGGAAALTGFVVLYFVVRVGLRPLEKLNAGLKALGAGDYRIKLAPNVAPEFTELLSRFNALGDSLLAAESENRTLRGRLVSIQDDERKEIARELHDEIGPHLFAARAEAGLARQTVSKNTQTAAKAIEAVIASIDALQDGNRRILNWLRPAALEEMGLVESFDALRRLWERVRPDMKIEIDLPEVIPPLASEFEAALYRITQEALTNAARHSTANVVRISLNNHDDRELALSIADNGAGFDPTERRSGLGLLGIGERVATHGGTLELRRVTPHGLEVLASFPRGKIDVRG